MEKDVTQKNIWNTKHVIALVSFVIICTFYVTVVYLQIQAIDSRLGKKIVILNSLVEEVNELKQTIKPCQN